MNVFRYLGDSSSSFVPIFFADAQINLYYEKLLTCDQIFDFVTDLFWESRKEKGSHSRITIIKRQLMYSNRGCQTFVTGGSKIVMSKTNELDESLINPPFIHGL